MVVAEAGDVLAHPLFVAIAAPLAVACVVALVTSVTRSLTTDRDLRRYVLPHFAPPTPGHEDASLPAKVERAEQKRAEMVEQMVEQSARLDQLASKVEGHMATEQHDVTAAVEAALRSVLAEMARERAQEPS